MKILVLSDSHGAMGFMRRCLFRIQPQRVIHLGDFYEDAELLAQENPQILFHHVPGNCDLYRMVRYAPDILSYAVDGVPMYMTHGHRHNVKMTLTRLLADARASKAGAVLYGHTHIPDCHQEEDGLWVLNPGAAGRYGGSAGIIETENGKIVSCRLITAEDLEDAL